MSGKTSELEEKLKKRLLRCEGEIFSPPVQLSSRIERLPTAALPSKDWAALKSSEAPLATSSNYKRTWSEENAKRVAFQRSAHSLHVNSKKANSPPKLPDDNVTPISHAESQGPVASEVDASLEEPLSPPRVLEQVPSSMQRAPAEYDASKRPKPNGGPRHSWLVSSICCCIASLTIPVVFKYCVRLPATSGPETSMDTTSTSGMQRSNGVDREPRLFTTNGTTDDDKALLVVELDHMSVDMEPRVFTTNSTTEDEKDEALLVVKRDHVSVGGTRASLATPITDVGGGDADTRSKTMAETEMATRSSWKGSGKPIADMSDMESQQLSTTNAANDGIHDSTPEGKPHHISAGVSRASQAIRTFDADRGDAHGRIKTMAKTQAVGTASLSAVLLDVELELHHEALSSDRTMSGDISYEFHDFLTTYPTLTQAYRLGRVNVRPSDLLEGHEARVTAKIIIGNNGILPWPAATKLQLTFGEDLSLESLPLEVEVPPDAYTNLSLQLTLPARSSNHVSGSMWLLEAPGERFGPLLILEVWY